MEIIVNQSSQAGRWGKIYASAVDLASNRLSGDAFKWYVRLSLNRDGYSWSDKVPTEIVRELSDQGYMSVHGDDAEFYTIPRAGATTQPVSYQPPPKYEPPVRDNEMFVYGGSPEPVQELVQDDSDLPF